jgi:hypothetical protein
MGTHGEKRKYTQKKMPLPPFPTKIQKKKKNWTLLSAPKLLIGCLKIMVLKLVVIIFGLG